MLRQRQSREMAFCEAVANSVVGIAVSWVFTFTALPLLGLEPTAADAIIITACYFVLSVVRSYLLRRLFDVL
jgi:hypothetical protein